MQQLYLSVCGRPEEDKVHRFLADVVVLVEEVLGHQSQLVHVHHLHVGLGVVLGVHKVAEHETSEIVLFHHSWWEGRGEGRTLTHYALDLTCITLFLIECGA